MPYLNFDILTALPWELQERIFREIGNPTITARVSKAWKQKTDLAMQIELNLISHEKPKEKLNVTVFAYRVVFQIQKDTIYPNLPLISYVRYKQMGQAINARVNLRFWSELEESERYLKTVSHLSEVERADALFSWMRQDKAMQGIIRLDLSQREIIYISPEIYILSNLKELDLSHNPIAYLPRELGQLQNLCKINLSYTNLSDFPAEIEHLFSQKVEIMYENNSNAIHRVLTRRKSNTCALL